MLRESFSVRPIRCNLIAKIDSDEARRAIAAIIPDVDYVQGGDLSIENYQLMDTDGVFLFVRDKWAHAAKYLCGTMDVLVTDNFDFLHCEYDGSTPLYAALDLGAAITGTVWDKDEECE